jgi:glucan phosphorylase
VNTLRLWRSEATDAFDLVEFNAGSYPDAVAAKNQAEQITMVLYPNDQSEAGKELRLRQQYFLASASLQDILRRWVGCTGEDFRSFADGNCLQLNDTHPTVAIPELMRLLMDEHGLGWEQAWHICTRCFAYTNHTLLPEALERWSVRLFERAAAAHCWRSSTRSTPASCPWSRTAGPAIRARAAHVAHRGGRRPRCAWPTWGSSAASRSTVSRRCTRSC